MIVFPSPMVFLLIYFYTGETVNLIKDSSMYSSRHKPVLKVPDYKGLFLRQKLSNTVHSCSGDGKSQWIRVQVPGILVSSLYAFSSCYVSKDLFCFPLHFIIRQCIYFPFYVCFTQSSSDHGFPTRQRKDYFIRHKCFRAFLT